MVETRNFDERSSFRGSSTELMLTERYTRTAENEIAGARKQEQDAEAGQ